MDIEAPLASSGILQPVLGYSLSSVSVVEILGPASMVAAPGDILARVEKSWGCSLEGCSPEGRSWYFGVASASAVTEEDVRHYPSGGRMSSWVTVEVVPVQADSASYCTDSFHPDVDIAVVHADQVDTPWHHLSMRWMELHELVEVALVRSGP